MVSTKIIMKVTPKNVICNRSRKEQKQPVRPQGNMFTRTFLPIPVRAVVKQIPVCWNFTMWGEKDLAITRMVTGGWSIARIEAEIRKCRVYCANCHRKITVEELGWFRGKR
jgi:hypothetical protein